MIIEQIFVILARILFVGSEIIALLGFCFLFYKIIQVWIHREQSKRKITSTYIGLIGSFITLSISVSGIFLYFEAQNERKSQIEQFSGISEVIDNRIKKSLDSHISYFQAVSIKEKAFDTCEEMRQKSSDQEKVSKCEKITYANINTKFMNKPSRD